MKSEQGTRNIETQGAQGSCKHTDGLYQNRSYFLPETIKLKNSHIYKTTRPYISAYLAKQIKLKKWKMKESDSNEESALSNFP